MLLNDDDDIDNGDASDDNDGISTFWLHVTRDFCTRIKFTICFNYIMLLTRAFSESPQLILKQEICVGQFLKQNPMAISFLSFYYHPLN